MVVCPFPTSALRRPPLHDLRLDETPSAELLAEVYRLRVRAWGARTEAFPANIESWSDPFDPIARHFVIVAEGRPVAAARVTIHTALGHAPDGELYGAVNPADAQPPVAALSRLVVCPSYAKHGLSRWLDVERLTYARKSGCLSAVVCTGTAAQRIDQLQALGFRCLYRARTQVGGVLATTSPPFILALDLRRR